MADQTRRLDYLRQSPLAPLGLIARAQEDRGEEGVAMAERWRLGIVDLRIRAEDGDALAAAEAALGFALPREPNRSAGTTAMTALWLGPDEWWVIANGGQDWAALLSAALGGQTAAVTEIGESRASIRVAGPRARDLLAKGCPLDLHPRVFGAGHCAGSHLAKAQIVLHQVSDEPAFDLYVLRSFADYLWRWLEDAAGEYGLAVVACEMKGADRS